jgi:hemoglobin-like flavoprotein
LTLNEIPEIYVLSNNQKGQVSKIDDNLLDGVSIGDSLGFNSQKRIYDFNVYVDGIKLYRPIKFKNLPESKARVKKPILFVGKYEPDLSALELKDSGGELEFEAYILWSPKVSPRDHNGSLIRINDASGILFEENFMKHQVAEHTIKSQLTAEIFVTKGMDSALNIDRESFNIAHPHYQIVMRWLHNAIRQVVNRYKQIKKEVQVEIANEYGDAFSNSIVEIVSRSYVSNEKDPNERSNLVMLDDLSSEIKEFSFNQETVHEEKTIITKTVTDNFVVKESKLKSVFSQISKNKTKQKNLIVRSEAILQILDSYNLLDSLTVDKQQRLVLDLIEVLSVEV